MRSRPCRRRKGASLVELVLIMGVVTVILGTCAVYTHMLLRLERSGREVSSDVTTSARLARQFREDVRAASNARLEPGKGREADRLVLIYEGNDEVSYSVESGGLVRVEHRGGRSRREGYRHALHAPPRFEIAGKVVQFTLSRKPDQSSESLRPGLVVEALLGKDGRFSAKGGTPR